MSERNQLFAVLTWSDLIETLESLQHERSMQDAGMTFCEVTDLVQAQLFRNHPLLAIRAARVIEVRCAQSGTVLYLRTGITVGSDSAAPEAGAFLPAIRVLNDQDSECRFVRHSRVKRGTNWRQNLRRRLREILRSGSSHGVDQSLAEIMTPEGDDLEVNLIPPPFPHSALNITERTVVAKSSPEQTVAIGTSHWVDVQAAGISLPVWMSAITSLALVLMLLLSTSSR